MKIVKFLLSPVMMGSLFIVFAVAMAAATFIENDFGSAASYGMVYNTKWFELILLLLALNLTGQIVIYKLFRKEKLPVALFHLAFIVIIAGAGITRYTGWEGSLKIREGESADIVYSNDMNMTFRVKEQETGRIIAEHTSEFNIASVRRYKGEVNDGIKDYRLTLTGIIPNAIESVEDDPEGEPLISLLSVSEMTGNTQFIIRRGETQVINDLKVGFESSEDEDISIRIDSGKFLISSDYALASRSMMSDEAHISEPGSEMELKPMQVYSVRNLRLVPRILSLAGIVKPVAADPERQNTGMNALAFSLSGSRELKTIYLWEGRQESPSSAYVSADGRDFEITYGPSYRKLPFTLRLNDFILERYPGSDSPSGYKSDVMVIDSQNGIEMPFLIYMNNILKYRGYRFYQSSYDPDEKGTILSVNHDRAGMLVTYAGYSMLFLFIVLSLIIKTSLFRNIRASAWSSSLRKPAAAVLFLFIAGGISPLYGQKFVPEKRSSDEFGKVLVQDQKGRTKPLYALASDIVRKVTRENKFDGNSSMQVFLGLMLDFENWQKVPLIRVSNKDLQRRLGITGNMASFSDIVDMSGRGGYKLSEDVDMVYRKSPGERNKQDKEIMKVDERVNVVYMIYRGDFLKMFPMKDGTQHWGMPEEALGSALSSEDTLYLRNVVPLLAESLQKGDLAAVRQITESVSGYQKRFAGYPLPPDSKVKAEILYYKAGIFERLFPFYFLIGLLMITILIIRLIQGKEGRRIVLTVLGWTLFAGFLVHTFGLGLRWYISGHSPMSNGYESMIFISWVTLLAGFLFSRRSVFTLPATAVLAGLTLLVAHMSFMDPEITSLVPVLQSYWLTLHVSVITGSYGFLGLGAILGIINLILISLSVPGNRERISETVDELTVINFKTLTLGLYFLTIGTFLGAIWANESWGRYWGWDPKETWSLITIIVYSFVTHSRQIPGLRDIYSFNLLSLIAFSSVLMTYFGVNYYLSGLHSYAGGDPVPVPGFVYVSVGLLILLAVISYFRYKRSAVK